MSEQLLDDFYSYPATRGHQPRTRHQSAAAAHFLGWLGEQPPDREQIDAHAAVPPPLRARLLGRTVFGDWPVTVGRITADALIGFVTEQARVQLPGSVGVLADSLQSFLRFIQLGGELLVDLTGAIPTPQHWSAAPLPPCLSEIAYSGLNTQIQLVNAPWLWALTGLLIAAAIIGKYLGAYTAARLCGIANQRPARSAGC